MTRLDPLGRRLTRLTGFEVQRGREVVAELAVEGLYLRGKGERRRLFISWADAFKHGVYLGELRKKAEKKRAKKLRQQERRAAA